MTDFNMFYNSLPLKEKLVLIKDYKRSRNTSYISDQNDEQAFIKFVLKSMIKEIPKNHMINNIPKQNIIENKPAKRKYTKRTNKVNDSLSYADMHSMTSSEFSAQKAKKERKQTKKNYIQSENLIKQIIANEEVMMNEASIEASHELNTNIDDNTYEEVSLEPTALIDSNLKNEQLQ